MTLGMRISSAKIDIVAASLPIEGPHGQQKGMVVRILANGKQITLMPSAGSPSGFSQILPSPADAGESRSVAETFATALAKPTVPRHEALFQKFSTMHAGISEWPAILLRIRD
jgi:hypothetical protein